MISVLFAAVSLLYATVGQAGGTAFLAVMAMAAFSFDQMRPTALLLNIVAAGYSTWRLNRSSLVDWRMLAPLLVLSLPAAFAGGLVVLEGHIYGVVTGSVLILSAGPLLFKAKVANQPEKRPTVPSAFLAGGGVGFISGLTGVGGGIFLAPLLIVLNWASPRQTAGLSAPFILANSIAGLAGALYAGQHVAQGVWLYALASLVGAFVGVSIGIRWMSQTATRYVLAAILVFAGARLLVR